MSYTVTTGATFNYCTYEITGFVARLDLGEADADQVSLGDSLDAWASLDLRVAIGLGHVDVNEAMGAARTAVLRVLREVQDGKVVEND